MSSPDGHRCREPGPPRADPPDGFIQHAIPRVAMLLMMIASHLFKAISVGAPMPRRTLIASGQCHRRSSVSTSIVSQGTTSPPSAPPHLAASYASTRGTRRGTTTIYIVVHPVLLSPFLWTMHWSLLGMALGVVPLVDTMVVLVHIHAHFVLIAMA